MLFKDAVSLPPQSSFRILSHQIAPDSTLNSSTSIRQQGTSKLTLKKWLVPLSIANNYSNEIAVEKAINVLMKVIHGIKGHANRVKIDPWKSKQTNLEVLKYIKGGTYPKSEVGKYIFDVRQGKSIEGRQYFSIQIYIANDLKWDNWYTTLIG